MNQKNQGIMAIAAALLVLASAMFNPLASAITSVVLLTAFGLYQLTLPKHAINPKQVTQKKEHLEAILSLAQNHETISNDDVEKYLEVSNATAERYLEELEKHGDLEQIGKRGPAVRYRLK